MLGWYRSDGAHEVPFKVVGIQLRVLPFLRRNSMNYKSQIILKVVLKVIPRVL